MGTNNQTNPGPAPGQVFCEGRWWDTLRSAVERITARAPHKWWSYERDADGWYSVDIGGDRRPAPSDLATAEIETLRDRLRRLESLVCDGKVVLYEDKGGNVVRVPAQRLRVPTAFPHLSEIDRANAWWRPEGVVDLLLDPTWEALVPGPNQRRVPTNWKRPAPLPPDRWAHWCDRDTWITEEFLALLLEHDPRDPAYNPVGPACFLAGWREDVLTPADRDAAEIVLSSRPPDASQGEPRSIAGSKVRAYSPHGWVQWIATKSSVRMPDGMRQAAERRGWIPPSSSPPATSGRAENERAAEPEPERGEPGDVELQRALATVEEALNTPKRNRKMPSNAERAFARAQLRRCWLDRAWVSRPWERLEPFANQEGLTMTGDPRGDGKLFVLLNEPPVETKRVGEKGNWIRRAIEETLRSYARKPPA